MVKQILIIGLGHFGMSLAKSLSEKGAEVIAADKRKALVEEVSDYVQEAIVMDATDEVELSKLNPKSKDCAICAIGDEAKEGSIICTALLRQMGAPFVVARANDKMHERILKLVGAHQVVNPENEFGKRFANKIFYRNIINETALGDDIHLTEIRVQPSMVGKSLVDLALPKKYGVIVTAVRRGDNAKILQPIPTEKLQEGDRLIIVSSESSFVDFMKAF